MGRRTVWMLWGCAACSPSSPDTATGAPASAPICAPATALVMEQDLGDRRVYLYEAPLRAQDLLPGTVDSFTQGEFETYVDTLQEAFDDVDLRDQVALLERQRDVFDNAGFGNPEPWNAVISGEVGTLTDVTCLQSILFDQQNQDWPLWNAPTEAGAWVLTREQGGSTELRVHLLTQDAAMGIFGEEHRTAAEASIAEGWTLFAHWHNHFYAPNNPDDLAGTVLPSDADLATYRDLRDTHGLEQAWVTNGLHALLLPREEFDAL